MLCMATPLQCSAWMIDQTCTTSLPDQQDKPFAEVFLAQISDTNWSPIETDCIGEQRIGPRDAAQSAPLYQLLP